MTNKECRDTRREIDELELGYRPGVRATTHLAACVACRQFQAERTSLRELVGSLEPVVAPPDFDMRLRARIAAEKYDNRPQPFFARLVSTPALAAAALFVIVAGSVVWISRTPSIPPVTPQNPAVATKNPQLKAPETVNESGTPEAAAAEENRYVAVNDSSKVARRTRPQPVRSEAYDVTGVDVIRQTDPDQAYVPSRPVEFALQNQSGQTRKISLPPVSFGAQNLVGTNHRDINYSPSSRVW